MMHRIMRPNTLQPARNSLQKIKPLRAAVPQLSNNRSRCAGVVHDARSDIAIAGAECGKCPKAGTTLWHLPGVEVRRLHCRNLVLWGR